MKARYATHAAVILVLFLGLTVFGQSTDPFDAPWNDRSVFANSLVSAERSVLNQLPGATVYRMRLRLADDYRSLDGVLDVHYTNREIEDLSDIVFRLFANAAGGRMIVSQVSVDEEPVEPMLESDDTLLRILLSAPLTPDEAVALHLEFHLAVPDEPAPWGPFGFVDGILSLDAFYPVIPSYRDGWLAADIPPQGDWTSLDASFYLVEVTAPSATVLASAGVEVARSVSNDVQTVSYAIGPSRDFYLAACELYETYRETQDEVTITHYFFPGGERQAQSATVVAKRMLSTYSELFGPYPYTEFDIVTTFMQNGSAMEYPSIIAVTRDIYDRSAIYFGVVPSQTMFEIGIVHEGAHQWFYNVVGNDQIGEPWVDEAVAQYCSFLYYNARASYMGRNYKRDWWDLKWDRVDHAEVPIGLSCWEYTAENYGPIVYGRGPYFFDVLADTLGTSTAGAFLRTYYERYKWGIATTESLRQVAEELCGCDLSALFDAWVYDHPPE